MKKRILSLFMAFCILFGSIVFSPLASAADTLVHTDHDGMFGAHLLSRTEITKKGDGTFDVIIDMYTYYAVLKGNSNVTSSSDDYYKVDRDGKYLVELWGGDGASTGSAKGGLGGYTYGILDLKVGDVLYYTLGGAGSVSAEAGKGGGANGGGGAGDKGSTAVGGGGGYSALYFYENGTEADAFYQNYIDSDEHLTGDLREVDRTSKYIMIAGGGGGAGAAGGDNRGQANGGDGGHFGTASGALSGDGYAVTGSFYAGLDGSSTDGTGDYAGKGGSYIPGKVVSTVFGWGEGGQPNDWVGAQNKNLEGGAGGTGNYRGGGGGGGFSGGSGGVVSNIALALGVGGGGGGSSFVFDDERFTTELSDAAKEYAVGRERTEQRESDEDGVLGGLFHIVYLDEADVSYLSDLSVEFARTPFFNITAFSAVNTVNGVPKTYEFIEKDTEEERESKINIDYVSYSLSDNSFSAIDENTPAGSVSTLKFKIPRVSLMPNSVTGEDRDHLTIKLTFAPKEGFAGGNNIPLFAGSEIVARPADMNEHTEHISGEVSMKTFCGYVNVPLKLNPAPVNHTPQGLDPEKMVHKVSSLYVDRYESVRDSLDSHWQYCFLESIGAHTVTDEFGEDVPVFKTDGSENTVSPDETTRYFVSLEATAKKPIGTTFARLGDPVTTQTFTGVSVITIAGSGMDALGENMLVYNKTLTYAGGFYTLGLHVSSDSSGSIQSEGSKPTFSNVQYGSDADENGQAVSRISTVQIPIDGVYTITLKGGNGGKGGGASFSLLGATGGKGGVGGNISATFSLSAGTRLMFYAGKNADDQSLTNKGAAGGAPSYVAILNESGNIDYYLMIAAGGPGGGGAGALWSDGINGAQPTGITLSSTKLTTEAELSAYTGKAGNDGGWGGSGQAGTAGTSYIYQSSTDDITYRSSQNLGTPEGTAAGGGASLTCDKLGKEGVKGNAAQLGKYKLETAISKYFTVEGVTLDMTAGTDGTVTSDTKTCIDKDTVTTETDYTYTLVTADITTTPVPLKTGDTIQHVEFTLYIKLKPRSGFLGGNDVKVIEPALATTGLFTGMKLSLSDGTDYIDVDESRMLDYANVAIDESLEEEITLETQNKTYVYGDTLYMKDLVAKVTLPDLSKYTWEADYLKLIDPSKDETLLTPDKTTTYTDEIIAGVGPLYEDPYATARPSNEVAAIVKKGTATVYTDFEVTFELKHIQLSIQPDESGRYLIPFGPDGAGGYVAVEDYSFTLQTTTGEAGHNHHLPKSITVKVGDRVLTEGVDYVYDRGYDTSASYGGSSSTIATVTIYKNSISGNVTVTAAACEEHHALYYVYQTSPDSEATTTLEIPDKHYSEHVLPEEDFETVGATLPEDTDHYTFVWDYGELEVDPEGHHVMPKGEAWVTGRYVPKEYTVKVEYVYEDGTEAAAPYTGSYAYGSEYSIVSPAVSGFVPSVATVSGKVDGNGDVTVTVTYTSAKGMLTVYYLYSDGTEAATPYTKSLTSGETFSIDSPSIVGYTASETTVSGTMDDDGHTVAVTYTPNLYTVTFKVDGEVLETRTVEYGNIYSYDPVSKTYNAFPSAIKLGYTFEGWTQNGVSVNAGDTVYITSDTVLEAKFKSLIFTVTVHYVTDLGATAHSSVSESFAVGDAYSYTSPLYKGHTPDQELVAGTVAAQNLVVTVTYHRNSYTVTVHYETPSGAPTVESYTAQLLHGESYSVPSPEIAGYKPNIALVEDVVNAADVTVTVTYYSTAITVDIAWGEMTFTYDLGEWDPETHTYKNGSFAAEGSNAVTVTNHTVEKDIGVTFEFMPQGAYSGVMGYFSADPNNREESKITAEVEIAKNGGSTTAYFYLEDNEALGTVALPDQFVAGHCTVTLRETQEVS